MAKVFAEKCGNADLLNELKLVIPESLPDRGNVWIDFEDKKTLWSDPIFLNLHCDGDETTVFKCQNSSSSTL